MGGEILSVNFQWPTVKKRNSPNKKGGGGNRQYNYNMGPNSMSSSTTTNSSQSMSNNPSDFSYIVPTMYAPPSAPNSAPHLVFPRPLNSKQKEFQNPTRELFVANLAPPIDEEAIFNVFSQFGVVEVCSHIYIIFYLFF